MSVFHFQLSNFLVISRFVLKPVYFVHQLLLLLTHQSNLLTRLLQQTLQFPDLILELHNLSIAILNFCRVFAEAQVFCLQVLDPLLQLLDRLRCAHVFYLKHINLL